MKRFTAAIVTILVTIGASLAVAPLPALAATGASKGDACDALTQLDTSQDCGSSAASGVVSNLASTVVTILSYIVGIVAVIMIIIGGLKYVASGGDSSKIASAKSTIVWALMGLAIAVLARAIVYFVLEKAR